MKRFYDYTVNLTCANPSVFEFTYRRDGFRAYIINKRLHVKFQVFAKGVGLVQLREVKTLLYEYVLPGTSSDLSNQNCGMEMFTKGDSTYYELFLQPHKKNTVFQLHLDWYMM